MLPFVRLEKTGKKDQGVQVYHLAPGPFIDVLDSRNILCYADLFRMAAY